MALQDFLNFLRGANENGLYKKGNAYFKEDPYAIGSPAGQYYDYNIYHRSEDPNPPLTGIDRDSAASSFYNLTERSVGDQISDYATMQKDFDVTDDDGNQKKYTVTYNYLPGKNWTIVGVEDVDTGDYYAGRDNLTKFFRNNFKMDQGYYDVRSSGTKNHSGGRMGSSEVYYDTTPYQYRYEVGSMPESSQFYAGALFNPNPSGTVGYKRYGGQ